MLRKFDYCDFLFFKSFHLKKKKLDPNYNYGAKGFDDPVPFHIKTMAHAEKEEMSENEQRKSRLLEYIAEDNPVFGEPRSWKGKATRHQGQSPRVSQRKAQT